MVLKSMTTSSNHAVHGLGYGWGIIDGNGDAVTVPKSASPSHGRSCTNCVRAKARCAGGGFADNGGKCERCHRMNKDCQPSPAVRKRTRVKLGTKTAQLEEKLEGLVELLKSATQTPQTGAASSTSFTGQPTLPPLNDTSGTCSTGPPISNPISKERFDSRMQYPVPIPIPISTPPGSIPTPHSARTSTPQFWEPSLREAEGYLHVFRTQYTRFLPFIFIPATTTVLELQQSRPFLWHSILTICTKSSRQQHTSAQEFRASLGREAFVEGTKSLDLLLAVLVYASWDQHHCFYKHIMGSLVHYSMALTYDLGLQKPPPKASQSVLLEYDDRGCPRPYRSPIRTLEERRALLGCFMLSSLSSSYFAKGDALPWTPYMEECCKQLEIEKEAPEDVLLLQLVRLQLIVDKATKSPWHDPHGDSSLVKAPAAFYIKALETQMQNFKRNVPEQLQQSEVLLLEIYSTELTIYEMALSKSPALFMDPDFQRLEYLYACLRNIKSWLNLFLSLPVADYIGFPLQMFRQVAHCAIGLYRLSTFEYQDWDTKFVRSTVNLSSLLDQVMRQLRLVKSVVGLDIGVSENIDSFHFLAEKLSRIKTFWDGKLAAETTEPADAPVNDMAGELSLEWGEDTWFPELLAPWDGLDQYFNVRGQKQ